MGQYVDVKAQEIINNPLAAENEGHCTHICLCGLPMAGARKYMAEVSKQYRMDNG